MQMVVEHIVKAFHADFARIWLIQPGDRCSLDCIHAQYKSGPHVCRHKELCLHLSASAGRYTHLDGKVHQRVPFGCYKIGRVASGKDEKFITDTVTKDLRVHDQKWAKELDLIGFAGYKLHSKDNQPLGVMALFTQHVISPEEDQFFETIAKTVAEVVQISYAEEALRASEERFRALVESTSDWIWEVNAKGVLTYCSPNVKELIGYNAEEMVGRRPFSIMAPDEAERNLKIFQRHVKEKSPIHNLESHSIHKRGHQVILETSGMPILDSKGNILGYRGIDRDITNRRHADETIRKSLEEKEILLKEIHHRVKNNLQIIISLLNLQSYRIEDKAAKQAFENSRQRVYSMALVHEKLYRSNNFANIQFNDYVKTMTTEIVRASVDISKVRLEIKVEAVELSIDLAIPFGLIINELITNSIKYAFPDERKGKIQILFKSVKDQYELTVIDDGIGLPDDVYFQKKGSLGMQLIHILTEQIGGSIEISREGGTRFTIQIDKPINRK
ncbi:PAS domain S-box protein [candidate division KSB1 bacterium]|nr:PAS domain S-box protein [candidate division KSB1 bacterium]